MSSVAPPSPTPPAPVSGSRTRISAHIDPTAQSKVRRDQLLATVVGIACLGVSMLMQSVLTSSRKEWNLVREAPESEKSLQSLAVTFPRLTLGGFRGVVSTALWMQAEEDKNNRNWIDLETKYDIIGGLQPYFVTVYIYHSWNQAYNLSAQWQEQDPKYKWVLDGMAYLYRGEDYNPGNADIFLETGHLYFLKLGGAFEKAFYRQHWRADLSRLHELNDKRLADSDATVALKRVREFANHHDGRFKAGDPNGDYLHIQELPDPSGVPNNPGFGISITDPGDPSKNFYLFSGRTDGKKPTDPMEFRYGVSPFYFAYCEYKRSIAAGGPSMMGMHVLDAWPAMCLRLWCRDDIYYTTEMLREMFGPAPNPVLAYPSPKFAERVNDIRDCFRNTQMIGPRAVDLFNAHLGKYPGNKNIHTKHIQETEAMMLISKAEFKLFETLVQWQINGRKLTNADGSPNVAIRTGLLEADQLYKDAYPPTMKWVETVYPTVPDQPVNPDRGDAERYANALQERSRGIEAMLSLAPNEKPDMSFLSEDVVEK